MTKQAKPMYNTTNTLVLQKNRLKHVAVDYLCVALFMLLIDIIVLIIALTLEDIAHANRILYIVIPIVSAICGFFLFFSIKRFLLYHAFNRARFNNEFIIKIDCKSIRFITYTHSRSMVDVLGYIFVDINCQKYVYILPKELIDSQIARLEARQKCVGKAVELICYNDTKMVKYWNVLS